MLKIWASTRIAAGWRGKLGRDKANACKVIRAHRWKALYSESDQREFYYNKDTGETRWEKPQCLLDLEPKPVCSNCADLWAVKNFIAQSASNLFIMAEKEGEKTTI